MQAQTANGWVPRGTPPTQREIAKRAEEAKIKFQRGVRAHNCGDFKEAIENYASASRYDPDHADAFHNLGVALLIVQKPAQAIEALDCAVQLRPTQVESILLLARALLDIGRDDDAVKLLQKSCQLLPDDKHLLDLKNETLQRLEKTSRDLIQS